MRMNISQALTLAVNELTEWSLGGGQDTSLLDRPTQKEGQKGRKKLRMDDGGHGNGQEKVLMATTLPDLRSISEVIIKMGRGQPDGLAPKDTSVQR